MERCPGMNTMVLWNNGGGVNHPAVGLDAQFVEIDVVTGGHAGRSLYCRTVLTDLF